MSIAHSTPKNVHWSKFAQKSDQHVLHTVKNKHLKKLLNGVRYEKNLNILKIRRMYSLTDEQKQKQTKNLNVHCLKNLKANIACILETRRDIANLLADLKTSEKR